MAENALAERADFLAKIAATIKKVADPAFRDMNVHQVRTRRDRFSSQFASLEQQNRLAIGYTNSDEDKAKMRKELADLEEPVMDTAALFEARILELEEAAAPPPAAAPATQQNGQIQVNVQMPFQPQNVADTWGKFNGNVLDWRDFKARFKIGVHDVTAIAPEFKIQYLRNSLTGSAAEVASGFSMIPASYEPLWNALIQKYEHKYRIASAYLDKFFALPALKAPVTTSELAKMSNTTNEMIRQLQEMEYPVNHWDLLIVHALQQRLDKALRSKWNTERGDDHTPTVAKMINFLEKQAHDIGSDDLSKAAMQIKIANERVNAGAGQGASAQVQLCSIHRDALHKTMDCPEFKPLPWNDRKKVAAVNRMCFLCLKRGHFTDECYSLYRCGERACKDRNDTKHHGMLCPARNGHEYAAMVSVNDGRGTKRPGATDRS